MRKAALLVTASFLAMAGGCATVSTPWQEQVRSYPLIGLGDPKPADGNYVVHLPAGKPVPTKIFLKGDLFAKETVQDVFATPKKDVYFYKDMVSFDLKTWTRTRAAIDIGWDVGIPSHKNPEPGYLKVIVNERKE